MYTLEEIAVLRRKCNELKLVGREVLDRYTDQDLQLICNGIGPDAFPQGVREFVTGIHPTLECCAFIHDVDFHESDGTCDHFTASNDRYARNAVILAEAAYGWYNPLRYIVILQGRRHARLCQLGGWKGYAEQGEVNDAQD